MGHLKTAFKSFTITTYFGQAILFYLGLSPILQKLKKQNKIKLIKAENN